MTLSDDILAEIVRLGRSMDDPAWGERCARLGHRVKDLPPADLAEFKRMFVSIVLAESRRP